MSLWQGKRQEARGKSEEGLGDFTFLYTVWFYCVHLLTRNGETTDVNLIEMLCAQLSDAVIQSQRLQQLQTLVDERTEQLQRSLEVQAKLYERTRQYVEQLQQLETSK